MQTKLKTCAHCGRVDNGSPRCRDHPPIPAGKRAFATLAEVGLDA